MIRFLHAADLHLGLRITRFEETACNRIREARFHALQQLRETAAKEQVDFVLIAGDLFDDYSVSRPDATRAFELLESSASACPVFIIPGNHDPLVPGGVWERDPWLREQPHRRVSFLRQSAPVPIPGLPVTLFPCPLKSRRSMDDPTAWIAQHPPETDETIRIGLAHGSLKTMPLPEDDHLIPADAAVRLGLDYLALGHWHRQAIHPSADGVARTAYCGVHEPLRFPGMSADSATGWSSFSADGDAERFQDDGHGRALLVTIQSPHAAPQIEPIEIGRLRWDSDHRNLTSEHVGSLISEFSRRENPERTVLRLALSGVVQPRDYVRLEELKQIVLNRFHAGSSLGADSVLIEPSAGQLSEVVGGGVLKRLLERLSEDVASPDPEVSQVSGQALKLLYQMAWEEQPQ